MLRKSLLLLVLFLVLLLASACRKSQVRSNEVVAIPAARIPLEPGDPAWEQAPEYFAKLIPQDQVEPRLMAVSTPEVRVRALAGGSEIAFRLEWSDANRSDLPGPGSFVDACGVQLPKKLEPQPPAPQMGEAGRPVEITFWRADWQASVNGRGDTIRDLYPNASVDHYPYEAAPLERGSPAQAEMARRYAPAEGLGNRRSGPRQSPVEDMVAQGPGTLSPAAVNGSKGKGIHTGQGWTVVISRRLPEGLVPRARTAVAFAVWEGSHKEVGARKMRTGWIPLLLREGK